MQPPIEKLRKNYQRMSDDVLIKIATSEAAGLRPEAIQVMQEEIKSRGLAEGLLSGIKIQTKELSENELLAYCELLRQLSCPVCNSAANKLNATITAKVISYIILTVAEDELVIACPDCLEKEHKNAMIKTALFGWWGIPKGLFKTIFALFQNWSKYKKVRIADASVYLKNFVLENIGSIEANKTSPDSLSTIIKRRD